MSFRDRYSTGIWVFGPAIERFNPIGYREDYPIETRIKQASNVERLRGLEFHYPLEISEANVDKVKELLEAYNFEPVAIVPALSQEPIWKDGALCALNEEIRREAIKRAKASMDIAEILRAPMIIIWPGRDGYDYPFQVNYTAVWDRFIKSVKEIAEYNPKIKVALEYKREDPRSFSLISDVGKTLTVINEMRLNNVGINIEIAHALMANENLAESISLISRYQRLFHTHFNDSFGRFDNDLIVGSIHFWQTLEMLFWLRELKYDGWIGLDLFPAREEPNEALRESIKNLEFLFNLSEKIDEEELRDALNKANIIKSQNVLRKLFR